MLLKESIMILNDFVLDNVQFNIVKSMEEILFPSNNYLNLENVEITNTEVNDVSLTEEILEQEEPTTAHIKVHSGILVETNSNNLSHEIIHQYKLEYKISLFITCYKPFIRVIRSYKRRRWKINKEIS